MVRFNGNGTVDTSFGISGHGLGAFAALGTNESGLALTFDGSGHPLIGGYSKGGLSGLSRLTYDLIFTNDLETVSRGCLPPNCS